MGHCKSEPMRGAAGCRPFVPTVPRAPTLVAPPCNPCRPLPLLQDALPLDWVLQPAAFTHVLYAVETAAGISYSMGPCPRLFRTTAWTRPRLDGPLCKATSKLAEALAWVKHAPRGGVAIDLGEPGRIAGLGSGEGGPEGSTLRPIGVQAAPEPCWCILGQLPRCAVDTNIPPPRLRCVPGRLVDPPGLLHAPCHLYRPR